MGQSVIGGKEISNEFNDSKGASTWLVALHSAYNGILDLINADPEVRLTHGS